MKIREIDNAYIPRKCTHNILTIYVSRKCSIFYISLYFITMYVGKLAFRWNSPWDFTCLEVCPHVGGMNSFSYKSFAMVKFTVLLRSHSGEISYTGGMPHLIQKAF